ncbi:MULTISPECIES: Hok/Gef family protein [unclassified Serratia (in: enterobacteria)]|uniref:Hok/Gef family protein n=1 Tax=unclassified Serratia (in: enterobacteria) TaxID=2647522 RepID=UPI001CBF5D9F|nr:MULTISPECIES: Hok/Gef family protein [unclassified Serratia (in: enterobacteria)]
MPKGKEKKAMEPRKLALMALIVVSITLLGVLLLNKNNLCEVSFRSGGTEIVAHMAYETK